MQQLDLNLPSAPERRKATPLARVTVAHRSGGATPQSIAASIAARATLKQCTKCNLPFTAHDHKATVCKKCRTTCGCGASKSKQAKYCKECGGRSPARLAQLAKLHAQTRSRQNPSKRPEVRRKISKSLRGGAHARYTLPGYEARLVEQAHKMQRFSKGLRSRVEISVGSLLEGFEPQYRLGRYAVDYASAKHKVAVEVQGCYWHCCNQCFPQGPETSSQVANVRRDRLKAEYIRSQGWKLIEIWEHEHNTELALLKITARIKHLCSPSPNSSHLKQLTNSLTMMESALGCTATHGKCELSSTGRHSTNKVQKQGCLETLAKSPL